MQDECKVYFFGDSISFGQGISLNKTWVARIADELHRISPDIAMTVQNVSVNGNTTRMALERMPYDVQSHNPNVLVVQFGMNDCNIWQTDFGLQRVSPGAFMANLREIIDRGRKFGASSILLVLIIQRHVSLANYRIVTLPMISRIDNIMN